MVKRIREGRWDCRLCGHKGNRGRFTNCENCEKPRTEDTTFYLPEDAPVVTDEKQLAIARGGADWFCSLCGGAVRKSTTKCPHCSGLSINVIDWEELQRRIRKQLLDEDAYNRRMFGEEFPDIIEGVDPPPKPKRRRSGPQLNFDLSGDAGKALTMVGLVVVSMTVLFGLWMLFFDTRQVEAHVDGFSWQRSIVIEEERTFIEEDWDVPFDGRMLSSSRKIRYYEDVLDHYETVAHDVCVDVQVGTESYACGTTSRDLGNGYFETETEYCDRAVYTTECHTEYSEEPVYRQEPVYDTYYRYEIDRWVTDRTERASGADRDPYWPEYWVGIDEREGHRSESYFVHFAALEPDEEDPSPYAVSQSRWQAFRIGSRYTLEVNRLGGVLSIAE